MATSPAPSLSNLLLLDGTTVAEGAELAGGATPPNIPPMAPSVEASVRGQAHAARNRNITCRQPVNHSTARSEEEEDDFYGYYRADDGQDEPLLVDHLVLEDYSVQNAGMSGPADINMINLAEIGEDRSRVPQPGQLRLFHRLHFV